MNIKSVFNSIKNVITNIIKPIFAIAPLKLSSQIVDPNTSPRICDISYAQSQGIDWAKLKMLGIAIVMRAGQYNYEDNLFRTHYANAVANQVPFGIYWFYQPNLDFNVQLNKLLQVWDSLAVKPKKIFIDVEPIVYTGVSVYPPSKEIHSYWLMNMLSGIESHTGVIPGVYTRANYWDVWTVRSGTRIVVGGMPYIMPSWNYYDLWIASWTNYSSNIFMPLDWDNWKIWQNEGGSGRQDGITGPVDLNAFYGTQDEMISYFGGEESQIMTSLYNTTVLQKDRARIFSYEGNTKLAVAPIDLGIDAVILPMGTMHNYNGSHWITKVEETFVGRFDLFNNVSIPVMGRFDLDSGALLKEQHTAPEFEGKPIRENWILPYLLTPWLIGNYDPHNFDWETVLSGNAKWRDVKAIILQDTETDGYPTGKNTGDDWQTRLFNYVFNHLRFLIDNKMCPDVPVILYTGGWFLTQYRTQFGNMLSVNKDKLYLHLGQWVNYSTATFGTLGEIFAFPPIDSFKFETKDSTGKVVYTYPDGYFERILMHEFTGQYQKCKQITDVNGNPVTVNLSLWQDTPEKLKTFFRTSGSSTPPVPPPNTELESRVIVLENRLNDLENRTNILESSMNKIMKWFNGIIEKILELNSQ